MIDIADATLRQLITFYNHNSGSKVESFPDLITAREICEPLMPDARLVANFGVTNCPHCDVRLSTEGVWEHQVTPDVELDERRFRCAACNAEFGPLLRPPRTRSKKKEKRPMLPRLPNGKHVDPRKQRSAVSVDGVRHSSVRQAFVALDLDLGAHVRWRQELKRRKTLVDDAGRKWTIIPLNY